MKEGGPGLIELPPCDFPGGFKESKEIYKLVCSVPHLRLEHNT